MLSCRTAQDRPPWAETMLGPRGRTAAVQIPALLLVWFWAGDLEGRTPKAI